MTAPSPSTTNDQMQETIAFTATERNAIEALKKRYPHPKAAIMPVLWMAQKKWGWLSTDVIAHVADVMELPYAHVYGVASFYTMYFKKPMGTWHVQVCTNISCMLRGGERLYDHVSGRFGIGHMERTPDGRFSLEEVECMGACGGAPMVAINEDYHENLSIELLDRLLDALPERPAETPDAPGEPVPDASRATPGEPAPQTMPRQDADQIREEATPGATDPTVGGAPPNDDGQDSAADE